MVGGGDFFIFTVFLSLVKIISLCVNLKEFRVTGNLATDRKTKTDIQQKYNKQICSMLTFIMGCYFSIAEPHHTDAAPAPRKNNDSAQPLFFS
jgi:hypothetical protein